MELKIPPGFRSLVALDREKHRGLGVPGDLGFGFASELNAVYLSHVEFFQAMRHYPIAFGRDADSEEYVPVAVTGLATGQNLFVNADGTWLEGAYVPAYVRRYPLFSVEVRGAGEADVMVCVDEAALSADAPPLYDQKGEATDEWRAREKLVQDMESARRRTQVFARALDQLGLMEPFEARVQPKSGEPFHLRGLHRVQEEQLRKLAAKSLKELMAAGHLSRVYAHLISLENFAPLLDRAVGLREAGE